MDIGTLFRMTSSYGIELTKQPVLMGLFLNKIGEYEGNEEVDLVD
jgi:hypothetical protein